MADAAEAAFISNFARTLSAQPVVYPNDYRQPPENSLRKVPVIPIEVPPPPKRVQDSPASTSGTITLTIKSLKPSYTFTLTTSPSDSIAQLKATLASQPNAPPADAQRLLLKGKVLADTKLLQEYSVSDNSTLNLSLKPGVTWDPSAPAPEAVPSPLTPLKMQTSPDPSPGSLSPNRVAADLPDIEPPPQRSPPIVALTEPPPDQPGSAPGGGSKPKRGHARIPSVVLSPSPSGTSPVDEKPADILLTFDTSSIPTASEVAGPPNNTLHKTVSDPGFWTRLLGFLRNEFPRADDAQETFENFLNSSKGSLSPHEIAKIRDQVGIIGMAGI